MANKNEKTEKEDEELQNGIGLETDELNTPTQDPTQDEEEEVPKVPRKGTQSKAPSKVLPKRSTRKATKQYLPSSLS
jgi:hypothetical protein